MPITGLVRRPRSIGIGMPGVPIVADVLPVTIVVEVFDPGNIFIYVLIADISPIRIVVIRIFEIGVVVAIAPIVSARITIVIVTVEHRTCLPGIDARNHATVIALTSKRQSLALFNKTVSPRADYLRASAVCGRHSIAIVINRNLIDARLLRIESPARRRYLEGLPGRQRAHVKQPGPVAKCYLSLIS